MAGIIHMPIRKHHFRPYTGPKVLAAVAATSLLAGLLLGAAAAHQLDTPAAQSIGVAAPGNKGERVAQPSQPDRREDWSVRTQYLD
jgi:hypothetical protein